jgi:hypothetical protein
MLKLFSTIKSKLVNAWCHIFRMDNNTPVVLFFLISLSNRKHTSPKDLGLLDIPSLNQGICYMDTFQDQR